METNHNPTNELRAIGLADAWKGKTVEIHGLGGCLKLPKVEHNTIIQTSHRTGATTRFQVEAIPEIPGAVAFRVAGPEELCLTNIMYGDRERQALATELSATSELLVDAIPLIVDFAIGRASDDNNFEGAGFNYSPMRAQRASHNGPNKLQMFQLERAAQPHAGRSLGIKSLFGTYWRSQHWSGTVSQSPHLLGDEKWSLRDIK